MQLIKKIIVLILTLESRLVLKRYKPFVVAVTGSVGKTATKDAIFSVLKDFVPEGTAAGKGRRTGLVRKSEKSMNSEIGLPLTIIGAPNAWRNVSGWLKNIVTGFGLIFDRADYPACLILELGADHPGDIRKAAAWLRPDIAVITRVSATPVHVEFFSSPEEVFEEKASLADAVKKGGSLALLADDAKVLSIAERVKDKGVSVITFGTAENATVRGSDYAITYEGGGAGSDRRVPAGFSFNLSMDGTSASVSVRNVLGVTSMYPLLAAAAVGKARGMPVEAIITELNGHEAPRGRMNVIAGLNGSTIIDDTYNSSPDAASAALQTLVDIGGSADGHMAGRKIAVLGDMMELGTYSAEEHRTIGREAAAVLGPSGILVTVGLRSQATAGEALASGMPAERIFSFDSSAEAAAALPAHVQPGDIILVKGSQSPRLERVAKALLREPEKAGELLVRQEKEWLDKA